MRVRRQCPPPPPSLRTGISRLPALREGQVVLADLVVLGEVGVIIVLAVPLGEGRDLGAQCHGRLERQLERLAVHDRQCPRQPQRHRVGLRVGRQAEVGAAPGEHLALGLELHVDLQSDDDLVVHVSSPCLRRVPASRSSLPRPRWAGIRRLTSSKFRVHSRRRPPVFLTDPWSIQEILTDRLEDARIPLSCRPAFLTIGPEISKRIRWSPLSSCAETTIV